MSATVPARQSLSGTLDAGDFGPIEKLYKELLQRPIGRLEDLTQWLTDYSNLSASVGEYGDRRYVDNSCHTDNEAIKKRYLQFVEKIEPRIKPIDFALRRKYLDSVHRAKLDPRRFGVLDRKWQTDVELYRDENVAIETEITRQVTQYHEISGAMTVKFRNKELTLQQIARFQEDNDRPTRKEAWELSSRRRLVDREALDSLFDSLLPLRQKIAKNAGQPDYRAYQWKALKRFDYTPDDCQRFADAIAMICTPLVHKLDKQRAADLKLEKLRPWDTAVDTLGRQPLRPFAENDIKGFVSKTREIFNRISPELAADFDKVSSAGNLDLDSRKGKRPGGYHMPLDKSRTSFIFMNAAGLQRDIDTLLHEGGHAFHHLAACSEDLIFLRSAPMEFCEVASMSMELLGAEHFDVFYDPEKIARARRFQLEGILRFFPWMATIDQFQHWIYTNPTHDRAQRQATWLKLMDRFGSKLDWSGHEATRQSFWHRQLHLFAAPFYYIEYGIAQLGALQIWLKAKTDPQGALANYRAALALGGTRTLPKLFSAAGIVFDFSHKTLRPLIEAVAEELDRLPR